MLRRAVKIKDTLDLFVARHSSAKEEDISLINYIITPDDWNYTIEVIYFIEPFKELIITLQGKSISGKLTFRTFVYLLINPRC